MVHRHELHGGDAEVLEIPDGGGAADAGVGAAQLGGHVFPELGEAAHVGLVEDGLVQRAGRAGDVVPGEGGVHDDGLGHEDGVVAVVEAQVGGVVADAVAEHAVVPLDVAGDGLGVGIEEEFVGVETQALFGLVRALDAVAVELAGLQLGEEAVPDVVGAFGEPDAVRLGPPEIVEEAQLDAGGVFGKEREVDAVAAPRRAERVGLALPEMVGLHREPPWSAVVGARRGRRGGLIRGSVARERATRYRGEAGAGERGMSGRVLPGLCAKEISVAVGPTKIRGSADRGNDNGGDGHRWETVYPSWRRKRIGARPQRAVGRRGRRGRGFRRCSRCAPTGWRGARGRGRCRGGASASGARGRSRWS